MNKAIVDKFAVIDNNGRTLLTPFVVSKSRKTLYLHIAKTGGSTITKILRINKLDDMFLTNKKRAYDKKLECFRDVVKRWGKYFKFTMVRNKYDMLVSLWHYDGKPGGTFKKFIKKIVSSSDDIYGYWIDQYYLTMLDGKPIFDFVGRYDNFNRDLKVMMTKAGIGKYSNKIRANQGSYNHRVHFSKYYDEETRDIVYRKFQKEIDYFGFGL